MGADPAGRCVQWMIECLCGAVFGVLIEDWLRAALVLFKQVGDPTQIVLLLVRPLPIEGWTGIVM